MVGITEADDYAVLHENGFHFYFGFNSSQGESLEDGVFEVKKWGMQIFTKTAEEIKTAYPDKVFWLPIDYLLSGMSMLPKTK